MKLVKCKKLLVSALAATLVLSQLGEISVKAEETDAQITEMEREELMESESTEGESAEPGISEESGETEPGASEESGETEPGTSEESGETEPGASEESGETEPGMTEDSVEPETGEKEETDAMSEENASEDTEMLSEEKAEYTLNGSGTAEAPYQVATVEDLKFIAEKVNGGDSVYRKACYQLIADIDLNGSDTNQWTPIGADTNKSFTGTFDGNGHTISGLYINDSSKDNVGLFGAIASPGKLVGITVNGATVHGNQNVGTIAGSAFTGTIERCKVTGTIDISGHYKVGGMFGEGYASISDSSVMAAEGSKIVGVYVERNREGDNVGGLIGYRGEGAILTQNCSVSGVTVAGTRKVGGLIGSAFANNQINNCSVSNVSLACNAPYSYASGGLVKNQLCVGGLVGLFHKNGSNGGTLSGCSVSNVAFSVTDETVREQNLPIMGIVSGGYRASSFSGASAPDGQIIIENLTVSGTNTGSNAEVKFPGSVAMNGVQKIFANGSGTKEDPYILSSIEDLKKFADTVTNTGITYKDQYLKAAEGTVFDLSAEQWKSIGSSSKRFMGTFDGNGATVKGLTDSLFGGIEDASVKNLKLEDVKIASGSNKGGLVKGNIYGSTTIEGIEVSGSIAGSDYIGGIIGGRATMEDGDIITIKNCINRATITASTKGKCGGIVGYTNSSKGTWVIENCKNYGDITSAYWAGGISGGTTRVTVSSCTNEGKIQGEEVTGGIIGTANSGTTVTGCVNKGDVTDAKGSAGGMIGSSSSGGNKVSQSANTGNITGVTNAGGIIGGTAAAGDTIENCYNGGDITATGEKAVAAGIYGYNNSTNPIKACVNDGKITVPDSGTAYPIGLSNYWYDQATGDKIATCYHLKDGKIYAVNEDGKGEPVEQGDMTRTDLAEVLNVAGGVDGFWQAQNGSVQPDALISGAFDDNEKRVALILDENGTEIEGYTSLEEAVNAVENGQTVVLEKDCILKNTLAITGGKEFTLDLKGKTITLQEGVKAPVLEIGNKAGTDAGKFTLTDTAEIKGAIESGVNVAAICVRPGASMTVKNVKINFKDSDMSAANTAIQVQGTLNVEEGTEITSTEYGITVIGEGAALIVNGGKINAQYSAVSGNGTMGGTEITINGGELCSTGSAGIYHPQNGKLTLNGGVITGLTGVQMCAGTLEIPQNSKVEVTATGEDKRTEKGAGDGSIDDGAAISVVNRGYPGGMPTVSIGGGIFVAEKTDHAVLTYTWNADAEEGKKHSEWKEAGDYVAVSGGIYNRPIEENLLADGFALNEPDKDGNYGVHKHNMTKTDKKDATCTESGVSKTYYQCSVCGKCFEDELGNIEITETDSLVIPAKGHNYVDGKCTICGAILDSKPEEKPEDKPDSKPDNKPEDKPGSKPDNKPDNKPGNADTIHPQSGQSSNAVETGDSTNVVLWITVFVIAAGMLVGGFICMKRRKNK